MNAQLINLSDKRKQRKQKSNARVFEAMESFYQASLESPAICQIMASDEMEEMLVQLLGDQLTLNLEPENRITQLKQRYRQFNKRLKACLATKLKTLQHFDCFETNLI